MEKFGICLISPKLFVYHLPIPLFPETTGLLMNGQNPSKNSTMLKENNVAKKGECSQRWGQKRDSF